MSERNAAPVKRGRQLLHTPGPTMIPERILRAMDRAALDHEKSGPGKIGVRVRFSMVFRRIQVGSAPRVGARRTRRLGDSRPMLAHSFIVNSRWRYEDDMHYRNRKAHASFKPARHAATACDYSSGGPDPRAQRFAIRAGFINSGRLATPALCNEAEPGSLALRLTASPSKASTAPLLKTTARSATCLTDNLHGRFLSTC